MLGTNGLTDDVVPADDFAPLDGAVEKVKFNTLCRHYLAGRCNFADCRFSHDASMDMEPNFSANPLEGEARGRKANVPGGLCRHFLQGTCNYGDACRFPHETSQPLDIDPPSTIDVDPPSTIDVDPPSRVDGDQERSGPIYTTPCRHFQNGKCFFGDLCQFSHIDMPVESPREGTVCRHFLVGRCERGNDCRFAHPGAQQGYPPQEAPPAPVAPDRICRHFLQGRCTYGDKCTFPHTAAPAAPKPTPVSYDPGYYAAPRPRLYGPATNINAIAYPSAPPAYYAPPAAAYAPPATAYNPDSGSICRHFMEGKCSYGDNCRFRHGPPPAASHSASAAPAATNGQQVCRHFLVGRCERGAECRFVHPGASEGESPQRVGEVCRHFLQGRCNRGDECRFPHTEPSSSRYEPY